jgi:hypothetical protein
MVSVGFLSLTSVGVGVEAVRLVEPVVEEVKVNKQLLADANNLMTDARIKGMKAVVSLATHESCCFGRLQSRWATYCFWKFEQLGESVVCVWREGGCVAGWTRELCLFGRLQSRWATYRFWKWRQLGEGVVFVWQEGGCVAGWTHELCLVGRLQSRWATYCFGK